MPSAASVVIHPSQFPEAVRRDLLDSFRQRAVNHKFHYDSYRQTQKWLALHEAFSPARTDASCRDAYAASFAAAASTAASKNLQVIGLGCGGGQKELELIRQLKSHGKAVEFIPHDVSLPMVLAARNHVLQAIPDLVCRPVVADLATAQDFSTTLSALTTPQVQRIITFFGLVPNFESDEILARLASLLRPDDLLLFSANLAPGDDYSAGLQKILPQYDNALTRDWLLAFLFDFGIDAQAGELRFTIENDPAGSGLKRVEANFHFTRPAQVVLPEESFTFARGDRFRLFFSYRHTPNFVRELLGQHGIQVQQHWLSNSADEGVFLCRKI